MPTDKNGLPILQVKILYKKIINNKKSTIHKPFYQVDLFQQCNPVFNLNHYIQIAMILIEYAVLDLLIYAILCTHISSSTC